MLSRAGRSELLSRRHFLDLLVARATEGLSADEFIQLERALAGQTELGNDDLDLAAAAVHLAYDATDGHTATIPPALKSRILRSYEAL